MDLNRRAEDAAREAWEGGDYEAKVAWRNLPAERRRSLVGFARRVLEWTGEEDSHRLRSALYRHYDATPRHGSMSWLGFNGDRFHPAHFAVLAVDNGDGSETRYLCRAEYVEGDHHRRRLIAKAGGDPHEVKITREAEWQFYHETYWRERIEKPEPGAFVADDGVHYTIGEERGGPKEFRGFAGAEATVFYPDGRIVYTTNLWRQGPVPPQVRDEVAAVVPSATLIWGHHTEIHSPPHHRSVFEGGGCPTCQPVEVPT